MDEATRKYLSETGQSETRHLLCVECEHRIQFLPSAEGMEGLCPKCGTSQTLVHSTSLDKSEVQDKPEDGNPIESPQNDTNRLLRQIEENTRRTKEVSEKFLFWFITLPLVIGAIILIMQGCD